MKYAVRDAGYHLETLKCPQLNWGVWWHSILHFPRLPPETLMPSDVSHIPWQEDARQHSLKQHLQFREEALIKGTRETLFLQKDLQQLVFFREASKLMELFKETLKQ